MVTFSTFASFNQACKVEKTSRKGKPAENPRVSKMNTFLLNTACIVFFQDGLFDKFSITFYKRLLVEHDQKKIYFYIFFHF